jgi:hypothetical protein
MPYTLLKFLWWLLIAIWAGLFLGYLFWGRNGRRVEALTTERDEFQAALAISKKDAESAHAAVATREVECEQHKAQLEVCRTELATARNDLASCRTELESSKLTIVQQSASVNDAKVLASEVHRLAGIVHEHQSILGDLRARNWNVESKLNDLHGMLDLRSQPRGPLPPAPLPPDVSQASALLGYTVEVDDLKVIEGIGPKVAQVLADGGISTWWELAHADLRWLRRLLAAAGPRFQLQRPDTWPRQARLLALGKWDEFLSLTSALTGGVER